MGSNRGITTITSAPKPLTADIAARRRNYLISMSIRMACFLGAIFVSGPLRWVLVAGAVVLPYIAVVFANAGREKADIPDAQFVARELPPGPGENAGGTAKDAGRAAASADGVPSGGTRPTGGQQAGASPAEQAPRPTGGAAAPHRTTRHDQETRHE